VPDLARKGGWVIITADKGTDRKKPSLPQLCREYKITCVAMTNSLAQKGTAMHQEVLHEIIRNIAAIYKAPLGTVISIGQTGQHGALIKFAFRVNRPGKPQISLETLLEEEGQ
jgi:hypothetical protein